MSKETDRVVGKKRPHSADRAELVDEELDRRLRRLEWPVAPAEVRDRGLIAVLARQASLAHPEWPPHR